MQSAVADSLAVRASHVRVQDKSRLHAGDELTDKKDNWWWQEGRK